MNFFQRFFGHLKTVLTHKWYVFYYACELGIPWQGFWHDMSKFHPIEFWESVKYYQGYRSPINACKEDKGWSACWMHHKGRNKHHYQYWIDNIDGGGDPVRMPIKYVKEMLADFLGAGNAYLGKKFTLEGEADWWFRKKENCPNMIMHPDTMAIVDEFMRLLKVSKVRAVSYIHLLEE